LQVLEFKRWKFKAFKVLEYDLLILENFDWIMEGCSFELFTVLCLQCFDTVGWAAGRASGL